MKFSNNEDTRWQISTILYLRRLLRSLPHQDVQSPAGAAVSGTKEESLESYRS